ncbi:MAG: OstA-like protein [Flavobacteriales bacterium]|nr:OstA-like protein [Flavobacteriales bacterium]
MKKNRFLHIIFLLLLVGTVSSAYAQDSTSRRPARIKIDNADLISNDENVSPGEQILTGNVRFYHGNTLMTCDKARYNRNENKFYAEGSVHVNEGDTLTLDCTNMDYIGDEELIKAYGNVVLHHKSTTLTTDTLDYDRIGQTAYYYHNATITDDKNILKSLIGIYTVPENIADFFVAVDAKSPDYQMYGDTLHYNTVSKVITVDGPTNILSKENRIYTENGVYNTKTEISDFSKNNQIFYDNRRLKGDKIHYDRFSGYARADENVEIQDTARKILVVGDVAEYYEPLDSAVIPENPRVAMFGKDTLYLRCNTIEIVPLKEKKELSNDDVLISMLVDSTLTKQQSLVDTTQKDTTVTISEKKEKDSVREMRAYGNVRYFKTDLAGVTDSITYNQKSGEMYMYGSPAVFSQENQITGDTIIVKRDMIKEVTDSVLIHQNAFIVNQDKNNPLQYNQLCGTIIKGKVINDDLRRVHIVGNAQTLYYSYDDKNILVGVNKSVASRMMVMMRNSKVERIRFFKSPTGEILPLEEVRDEAKFLKGYILREDERPHSAEEIWGKDVENVHLGY